MKEGHWFSCIKKGSTEIKKKKKTDSNNNPAVQNLKEILTRKWHLIQHQPSLDEIFREPPIQKGAFTQRHTGESKIITKAKRTRPCTPKSCRPVNPY